VASWQLDRADVRHAVVSDLLAGGQKINNPPNCPPKFVLMVHNLSGQLSGSS